MAAKKTKNSSPSILMHAGSDDPDMLYFSRFHAPDPYLAFSLGKRKIALANVLEFGRMQRESGFDEVLLLPDVQKAAAKRFRLPQGELASDRDVVRHLAREYGIREFLVGDRFPAGLALALRDTGVKIAAAAPRGLFPARVQKMADEVEAIRKGNLGSAAGFRAVSKALRESKVRSGGQLFLGGKVLTAERLRGLIEVAALEQGGIAQQTIVAPGDQACDCHEQGTGPIRAGELIVVDIFPRRPSDGYWGDMTRTFLKGKASDAQRRMVRAVRKAEQLAIGMIKPGVSGGAVHRAVEAFFNKEGYEAVKDSKEPSGFFHGLGHGLGLEVHEEPFMRPTATWKFKKGMCVTVEPGLYYRGIGGCRWEDVVHLVPGGNELISKAPYKWEIA
ncbi:MAG: M24 family metallopeptidase [Verrucomicrobiales bacterium]